MKNRIVKRNNSWVVQTKASIWFTKSFKWNTVTYTDFGIDGMRFENTQYFDSKQEARNYCRREGITI